MNETLFRDLSLEDQATWVQEHGQYLEAQDFYSFFVLIYVLNEHEVKLVYDFSGLLVSIERDESPQKDFLSSQLESTLD